MRKSEHKTTMIDVCLLLRQGPMTAKEIGRRCWPDKAAFGSSNGGPDAASVSASYLLGKLAKRKLVRRNPDDIYQWKLTHLGLEACKRLSI